MKKKELMWKLHEIDVDLYKFYLDVALKMAVFVFGITGGIVAFYLQNPTQQPLALFSLVLPLLMNVTFGLIYWRGMRRFRSLIKGHRKRAYELGTGRTLDLETLPWLLKVFTFQYFLVSLGLIYLIAAGLCIVVVTSGCS